MKKIASYSGYCLSAYLLLCSFCFSQTSEKPTSFALAAPELLTKSLDTLESAAQSGSDLGLTSEPDTNRAQKLKQVSHSVLNSLHQRKSNYQASPQVKTHRKIKKVVQSPKRQKLSSDFTKKKEVEVLQQKLSKERKARFKKQRERRPWFRIGKLLDLDWLLISLAILIPALLIALLYFLLGGGALTFMQMFIFSLGLGFAVFSYVFLNSEMEFGLANFDYFIKYGIATWPGLTSIIAGLVGLFGGSGGTFLGYFLTGLGIGLVTFIISLFTKRNLLNKDS